MSKTPKKPKTITMGKAVEKDISRLIKQISKAEKATQAEVDYANAMSAAYGYVGPSEPMPRGVLIGAGGSGGRMPIGTTTTTIKRAPRKKKPVDQSMYYGRKIANAFIDAKGAHIMLYDGACLHICDKNREDAHGYVDVSHIVDQSILKIEATGMVSNSSGSFTSLGIYTEAGGFSLTSRHSGKPTTKIWDWTITEWPDDSYLEAEQFDENIPF